MTQFVPLTVNNDPPTSPDGVSNADITPDDLLIMRLAKHYPCNLKELEAFALYFANASEIELFRINPRRISAITGLNLRLVIEMCMLAVHEGVFDLLWTVVCPSCKSELLLFPHLQEVVEQEANCMVCSITVESNADQFLHAVFSIKPAIRSLNLPSTEIKNSDGSEPGSVEELKAAATPQQIEFLRTLHRMDREYSPITSLDLMHLQLFRDFFRDEVLAVNISLKITRIALIFTNLAGSTALYAAQGDSKAYGLMRAYFKMLRDITNNHNGVIIKTIGDSVMASFQRDSDAVSAAIGFHNAIDKFNQANTECLVLRIGLHAGSCISVTQNNVMDYFGTNVNIASRINELGKCEDSSVIMVSKTTLAAPDVQAVIATHSFTATTGVAVRLRGLPYELEVCQLHPLI